MPLPKDIYRDPLVRQTWIEQRRTKLAGFDRLTGKGLHPARAGKVAKPEDA